MNSTEVDFNNILNKPFSSIFSSEELVDIIKNKGKAGTLLESKLGVIPEGKFRDFKDCEMKSYKVGESIAISMLSHLIEEIYNEVPFIFFSCLFLYFL